MEEIEVVVEEEEEDLEVEEISPEVEVMVGEVWDLTTEEVTGEEGVEDEEDYQQPIF